MIVVRRHPGSVILVPVYMGGARCLVHEFSILNYKPMNKRVSDMNHNPLGDSNDQLFSFLNPLPLLRVWGGIWEVHGDMLD